ncbi:protein-tyrosine phosphatase [Pseudomonas duriflava]|uniref:protein-tyrosine-phosphatase n=1 Tax=Pseudomonas duriflava TaxID=459528 RepID=A0A562Q9I0_9PSED|nr:low molecular weight protein-tyrosine-phosphatase [Pseudomonas duriflava]TWI53412.1 protein-tyrosine phosphatase [Pseudomonas duriflava]
MRILFVCMGNICRSPTAEAVLTQQLLSKKLSHRVSVDSAGTGDWHVGKAPDQRAIEAGAARGYDLSSLRARQVAVDDFHRFDLILAMDQDNLSRLEALRPQASTAQLDLFLRRYGLPVAEVPDPYFGEMDGFAQVIELIETGCQALIASIEEAA